MTIFVKYDISSNLINSMIFTFILMVKNESKNFKLKNNKLQRVLNDLSNFHSSKFKYVFVGTFINSSPGHDRNLRLVSLKPVWLEVENFDKKFPKSDQWPNYRTKCCATNAFQWQNFVIYFCRSFWRGPLPVQNNIIL